MQKRKSTSAIKVFFHEIRLILLICILMGCGYLGYNTVTRSMEQKNLDGIRDAIMFEL